MNLYDLSTMEVLSLACALVKAIDRHDEMTSCLDRRSSPVSDARTYAMTVAGLAAIEYLDPAGIGGDEVLQMAEDLLAAMGVRTM